MTKPNGTRTKHDPNRYNSILEQSAAIFRRQGYHATSLQDVADAVGIQKGSLYHHFDSKEDILFEIIEETHKATIETNVRWMDLPVGDLGRLRTFIEDHVRVTMKFGTYASVYLRELGSLSGPRKDKIVAARDEYQGRLRSLIEEGQDHGVVRAEVIPSLATYAILGMIGWSHLWYDPSGPLKPEDIVPALTDQALASVAIHT